MLWIYDCAAGRRERLWLLRDAASSVSRQHLLRGTQDPVSQDTGGVPLFTAVEASRPSLLTLSRGCAATVVAWSGLSLLITAGGHRPVRPELYGVHRLADSGVQYPDVAVRTAASSLSGSRFAGSRSWPRTGAAHAQTMNIWSKLASFIGMDSASELDIPRIQRRASALQAFPSQGLSWPQPGLLVPSRTGPPPPPDALFHQLDRDLDSQLSAKEIAAAPEVLLRLDRDQDGTLTAYECGLPGRSAASTAASLFAVLDRDHNGSLSAEEIAGAAAVLARLDANHDARLSQTEIRAKRQPALR
jgi:hypothetical protein